MTKPYFLIDFENVQPALDRLVPGQCRVLVFMGETTKRMDVDFAFALPRFGTDIQAIRITGTGPNAVDFHIAFYIGQLAVREPGVALTIVSKDTGFDPLVKHLKTKGINCRRIPDIPLPAIPKVAKPAAAATATSKQVAKKASPKAVTVTILPEPNGPGASVDAAADAMAAKIAGFLKKATRPTTLAKLQAFIRAHAQPHSPDAAAVDAVIRSLRRSRRIAIDGAKVTYGLG